MLGRLAKTDSLDGAAQAACSLAHLVYLERFFQLFGGFYEGGTAREPCGRDDKRNIGSAVSARELANEIEQPPFRAAPRYEPRWVRSHGDIVVRFALQRNIDIGPAGGRPMPLETFEDLEGSTAVVGREATTPFDAPMEVGLIAYTP